MNDDVDNNMEQSKQIIIKNENSGDYIAWMIFIMFVLFYNFGNNEYDLYDAIYNFFMKCR